MPKYNELKKILYNALKDAYNLRKPTKPFSDQESECDLPILYDRAERLGKQISTLEPVEEHSEISKLTEKLHTQGISKQDQLVEDIAGKIFNYWAACDMVETTFPEKKETRMQLSKRFATSVATHIRENVNVYFKPVIYFKYPFNNENIKTHKIVPR